MKSNYYTEECTYRRNAVSALKRMQKMEKRFRNGMVTKRLKNGTILSAKTQESLDEIEELYK